MTRTDDIAAARAADERIAEVWGIYWDAVDEQVAPAVLSVREARRLAKHAAGRNAERAAAAQTRLEAAIAREDAAREAVRPLRDAARTLDDELYTGWTRFYLVQHIHSSQSCSSFRPTTRVGWLPKLSGLTEAEAVAAHGSILCTKCFPSAPVEWTDGRGATDDGTCPGSGTPVSLAPSSRRGYAAGNWAECPECGKRVGMPGSAANVRKHARP